MRSFGIGFFVGVSVGVGGSYIVVKKLQEKRKEKLQFNYHPALKHGQPTGEIVRFYEGFVACYDFKTKNPKWVLEHLTKESVSGDAERAESSFFEDQAIDPKFRNKLSSFVGSGYDRGHLAPAANYKGSQNAMNESFSMCNVSPQVGIGFNRHYWARFEKFVKDVAKTADEVHVLTGPLWLPKSVEGKIVMQYDMIGQLPDLVSVPTHFYKVILAERGGPIMGKTYSVGAFVLPNTVIEKDMPLSTFVVPISVLETVAGLNFFPKILKQDQLSQLDKQAQKTRSQGLRQSQKIKSSKSLPLLTTHGVIGQETQTLRQSKSNSAQSSQLSFGVNFNETKHLCETITCALPSEDWWKVSKAEFEKQENEKIEEMIKAEEEKKELMQIQKQSK